MKQRLRLRIQAYTRELSRAIITKRVDQIRERLTHLTANVELLCELLEEDK